MQGSNIANPVKAGRVNGLVDPVGGREGGPSERVAWKRTQQRVENRQPVGIGCMNQLAASNPGLCDSLEGWDGVGSESGSTGREQAATDG